MRLNSRFSALVVARVVIATLASTASVTVFGSALEGTWVQPCQESDETWSSASHSYLGGQAAARYTMFEATGCQNKMLETASEGTYEVNSNSIDYTIAKVTLTVFGAEMVGYFNSVKFCGFKDWRSGIPQNVTGKTCEGEIMGGNFYDIWSVEGNSLFHGLTDESHDGKTPQSRPVALDRGAPLNRQ